MILSNAIQVLCNGVNDPLMFVNGKQVWPIAATYYTVTFEWSPSQLQNISLDGMGWGDEIGYIHTENVNWAAYDDGSVHELTTMEIVNATTDNGSACTKYCYKIVFNLNASTLSRFTELTFKTDQYYQPTGSLKVSIASDTTLFASKTVTMTPDTTYHIHTGDFDT